MKKGDVLVSGTMEILNDSLETAGYQYCAADADIRIRTSYAYYDSFPMVYEEKIYTGRRQTSYGIRIGQKSVSLPVPDTEYENEDILTSEKKLRLSETLSAGFPGDLRSPGIPDTDKALFSGRGGSPGLWSGFRKN